MGGDAVAPERIERFELGDDPLTRFGFDASRSLGREIPPAITPADQSSIPGRLQRKPAAAHALRLPPSIAYPRRLMRILKREYGGVVALVLATGCIMVAGCAEAPPPTVPSSPPAAPAAVPVAMVNATSATPVEQGLQVELRADGSVDVDGINASDDRIRKAFASNPHDRAVIHAAPDAVWGRVVHVLDQMKQAGVRSFVLAVSGDPALRTESLDFPQGALSGEVRTVLLVDLGLDGSVHVDGNALAGSLQERVKEGISRQHGELCVVVRADTKTRFALIVETARNAQVEGAVIAFAVAAPTALPNSPSNPSRPKPRPTTFSKCPFPAAADKAGVDTAVATLRVKVDATGTVTDVTIVEDPGHGFGAAAKACTAKASFEPARDPSGNAVAGELLTRVRFER
jgi:TonB family protein